MGAEGGQSLPDLSEQVRSLQREARRFSFYRLVYLLERTFPKAPPVGQLGPVVDERVRLRPDVSLVFAPGDVSDAVLYLSSAESRFVTGLTLTVDAGSTAR